MRTQVQLQIFFLDSAWDATRWRMWHAVVPGRRRRWLGLMGRRRRAERKVRRVTGGNQAVGDSENDVIDV